MVDDDLKENAPWLVILLTLGVALVSMLATLWYQRGAEPQDAQGTASEQAEKAPPPTEPSPAPQPTSEARIAETREPSSSVFGLFVTNALPPPPAETPVAAPETHREPQERPATEAALKEPALAEKDEGLLDSLGGLSKPEKQHEFGLSRKLWTAIMPQLAAHPKLIGYLLNNKHVVAGYMSRAKSKEVCSSPAAMAAYMTDPTRKDGIAPHAKLFHDMVRANPAIAGVVAGSELSAQIINSPGMKGFLGSPQAAMGIAKSPELLSLLTDPVVLNGLASNPNSAVLLGSLPGGRR